MILKQVWQGKVSKIVLEWKAHRDRQRVDSSSAQIYSKQETCLEWSPAKEIEPIAAYRLGIL
jgi:hypothetical protein